MRTSRTRACAWGERDDVGVEQARELEVGGVAGGAGDLLDAVDARYVRARRTGRRPRRVPCARAQAAFRGGLAHASLRTAAPRIAAAASCTASMICR